MSWAVRGLPFEPREFATGLAIFAIMPTTVSGCVRVRVRTHAREGSGPAAWACQGPGWQGDAASVRPSLSGLPRRIQPGPVWGPEGAGPDAAVGSCRGAALACWHDSPATVLVRSLSLRLQLGVGISLVSSAKVSKAQKGPRRQGRRPRSLCCLEASCIRRQAPADQAPCSSCCSAPPLARGTPRWPSS
jgi:hypothetical protein